MAPAASAAPDQDLLGVHIFRAGSYTLTRADGTKEKADYTDADVAQMAENANKLFELKMHEAPAKLGHDDDQAFAKMAGLPSVGWARRVVAKGKDMFADFSGVPAALAEAIRRGRYRHVSSEIYNPEQTKQNFGDVVKGFTLRAVAFLGADVPVVKGMNPLMLHEGAFCLSEGSQVTLEVVKMADKPGSLMVNANRHPLNALVAKKGSDAKLKIHAQHPDNTYDAHDIKTGETQKDIPHDDLTLLSETYIPKEEVMSKEAIEAAQADATASKATAAAALAERDALLAKITDDKIAAFAEKHKATLKQPPVLAAFKALAKSGAAPVKLAEGEKPYLEAFLAFAESLMAAKPVLFGEIAPTVKDKEGNVAKSTAVKLAEEVFVNTDANPSNHEAVHASIAVEARQLFAEKKFPTYKECLLSLTPTRMGKYIRGVGRYAEIEAEVA